MDIEQNKKKNSPLFIIILGALTAIGALSIDMFLPGLPELKMILIRLLQMHN